MEEVGRSIIKTHLKENFPRKGEVGFLVKSEAWRPGCKRILWH